MQDIAPSGQRRSIRDIKKSDLRQFPPARHIREVDDGMGVSAPTDSGSANVPPPEEPHYEYEDARRPKSGGKLWLWLLAALGLCIVAFAITSLFTYANVYITPVKTDITLSGAIDAYKTPSSGQLAFQTLSVTKTATKELPATKEEQVDRRASGTIIVYNAYSSQIQRLIKNTRFETPDGKIYRIMNSIDVPGVVVEGGNTIPGSIEVVVYADEAGTSYNIGLTDFTIPGLKGDARYSKFYARSKTPIAGGFSGIMKTIDESAFEAAKTELQASLKTSLLAEARASLPANTTLFEGAAQYMFADNDFLPEAQGGVVTVTETGTMNAMTFDSFGLSQFLARQTLGATYDGSPVLIDNLDSLAFSISDKGQYDPTKQEKIQVTLQGTGNLVWQVDEEKVKNALAGTPKDSFNTAIEDVAGIERAHGSIRPVWSGHFPDNPDKIRISFEDEGGESSGG